MEKNTQADIINTDFSVLFSKKITFSLKKKKTAHMYLL